MWKRARRLLRLILVGTVILNLSLDITLAGRHTRRARRGYVCPPGDAAPSKGKGAKGDAAQSGKWSADAGTTDDLVPDAPEMDTTSPSDRPVPMPSEPETFAPETEADPPAPVEVPDPVPAPPEEPTPTPPAEVPAEPAPEPPAEAPADPLDNLFDDPAPADTPAAPAPAEPAPADAPPPAPPAAPDPLDDLFDDPDGAAPAAPATEEPATPADPLDDLFGDPEPADPAAALDEQDAAPERDPLDDLFDDPIDSGAAIDSRLPTDLLLDEIFAASAAPIGAAAIREQPPVMDAPPIAPPTENVVAASAEAAAQSPVDDVQETDLAEQPAPPKSIPIAEAARLEVRAWVDDSGLYRLDGRLIAIMDGMVRIENESGKTYRVSLERLSNADVTYVESKRSRFATPDDLQLANQ